MDESGAKGLEEERRLAYVGLTRARETVEISFAANRRIYGNWQSSIPSRFVSEIPESEIEQFDEMGLSGDFFGGTVQSEAWGQDDFLSQTQLQRTKDRQPPNIKTATPLNIKIALRIDLVPRSLSTKLFLHPAIGCFIKNLEWVL